MVIKLVMSPRINKAAGQDIVIHWDGRDFLGRLKLVLDHRDLFWSLGLVTAGELEIATAMSESAKEYVISREDHPIFTSIHLKKDVETQCHREKLLAALQAVFD